MEETPPDLPDDPMATDETMEAAEPDGRADVYEGQTCVSAGIDICIWPDTRAGALEAFEAMP
jgi:hypothetical protein